MGILIGVFCVAIFMDWRFYRIPNVCIVIGMIAGLVLTSVNNSMTVDKICKVLRSRNGTVMII